MATVATANLMGITGIAQRLVVDGRPGGARRAQGDGCRGGREGAIGHLYLDRKLVAPAAMAAAYSLEFGMPLVDPREIDPSQSAINLVKEELLRKHQVLPLNRRGSRLFVGISDQTDLHRPVRRRHSWHHQHPERLPAGCVIDC